MTNQQSPEPARPRNRPLHDPAVIVATQTAAILPRCPLVVAASGDDRLDPLVTEVAPNLFAVVATIPDQPVRFAPRRPRPVGAVDGDCGERRLDELALGGRCRVQVKSQRSTLAIDQNHALRALPSLGLSDQGPPFRAGTKVPSMKHSSHRILSRSFNSARKARHRASNTPSASHCFSRRQQVVGLPYCRGNALQGAPVQRIHRIPSKHRRSSTRGRPPSGLGFTLGMWTRIFSHWASLTLFHAMPAPPCAWSLAQSTPPGQVMK